MATEVFLSDVPDINDRGLRNELEPLMKKLTIADWLVEKQRSRNRSIAWIRFLDEADGARFLDRYGTTGAFHKRQNRLTILGRKVVAVKSRNAPDEFAARALRHARDERQKKEARMGAGATQEPALAIVLQHHSFACGHNMFIDRNLNFIQEWEARGLNGSTTFGRRTIIIKHNVTSTPTTEPAVEMRVEISYDTIISSTHSDSSFLLVLDQPPRFFQVGIDRRSSRLTGLPGVSSESCLVYRLGISGSSKDLVQAWHRIVKLDKFECTTFDVPVRDPAFPPVNGRIEHHLAVFKKHIQAILENNTLPFEVLFQAEALVANNYLHPKTATEFLLAMDTCWRWERNRSPIPSFSGEALKRMIQNNSIDYAWRGADPDSLGAPALLETLLRTERALREEQVMRQELRRDQMNGKVWILRATVTPSRITLHGPEPESQNRILRKYGDHLDYFLRVQICEEDGEDLRFAPKVDYTPLRQRFERILQHGIAIAGRVYGFLGFSHSSLRARSVWLQAAFLDADRKLQTYMTIIRSLGDFDNIRVPAKCAARIGQAFTETPFAVSLRQCGIELCRISDVKTDDGGRVFSDGVGSITQQAMEELWRRMPYAGRKAAGATCFQIRLGSVKGMIAFDSRYDAKMIAIRQESMMKFPCDDWDELGVCEVANKPLKMYLNRQLIKILEDMGVKPAWFLRQQRKELDMLKRVTSSTWRTRLFLERQAVGTGFGFPKFLEDLEELDIDWRCDEFLRSVVYNVVMSEVRQLKHKSRIPISKGVTLFGVMDETGFLNEGEIFVSFDTKYEGTTDYIDQNVWSKTRRRAFVTRSPALHPGDVQLVWMVKPPDGHPLRQLMNCIVFPRRGARDLPSQLSGGDLDGDKYHVIWDPEAMHPDIQSFAPADYPRVTAPDLGRPVTKDDMIKHFLDFMQADQLGVIATRHMILADQRLSGTRDADCVKLAEIHSTAVDFSKSGVPVDIREMNNIARNKVRPDFLAPAPPAKLLDYGQFSFVEEEDDDGDDEGEAPKMNYYASEKILGDLYRNVDEKKIWNEDVNIKVAARGGASIWDQLLRVVNRDLNSHADGEVHWQNKLKAAWRTRDIFDAEVASLREQYAPTHRHRLPEVDVFCGHIFNRTGSQSRRQRDNTVKLREDTARNTDWLIRQIRSGGEAPATTVASSTIDALSTVTPLSGDYGDEAEEGEVRYNREALEMALACVMVASVRERDHFPESYTGDGKGASFRVVAARCLLREMRGLRAAWEGGLVKEGSEIDEIVGRMGGMGMGMGGGGSGGGVWLNGFR